MYINKLVGFNHDVFSGTCDAYDLFMLLIGLEVIGYRQLVNYCFIIQLNGCMSSFCCVDKFMMIVTFLVKLVNNKVEDNLLILIFLKFHGHGINGLRIIAVRSMLSDLLIL